MRRAETGMALALALFALAMVWESLELPVGWTGSGPGAGFFPFWLSVGLVLSGAVVFVQSLRPRGSGDKEFIPDRAWKPLLVAFLPMVAVIGLLDYLGIYLGGALYLAGYMRLVGRFRWLPILLVSVLVPLLLFFIFERWFLLLLPKGSILEYLLYER